MRAYNRLLQLSQNSLFEKDPSRAIAYAKRAKSIRDDDHRLYDILAESYMLIGRFDDAISSGLNALKLKDRLTDKYRAYPYPTTTIKTFDSSDKKRNIISYSLFGNDPKYCDNAIINAKIAKDIYPHWYCRFYCDSDVPLDIVDRLEQEGADVVVKDTIKDRSQMLLWRFLVMSDSSVDRYIVRDCDSILNTKESCAVEEWIASNKRFHIMRDFYTHTDLILAGMFGGTTDIFPHIDKMISHFHKIKHPNISHQDQLFLRIFIWQTIKQDALIHDRYFRMDSTQPFPPHPRQLKGHHIGECIG